jgi:hypothetical protein
MKTKLTAKARRAAQRRAISKLNKSTKAGLNDMKTLGLLPYKPGRKTLLCEIRFAGNCATAERKFKVYVNGFVCPPNLLAAWHKLNDLRNENLAIECELVKPFKGGFVNVNVNPNQSLLDVVLNLEECIEDYRRGGLSFDSKAEALASIQLVERLLVSARIQPNYKPLAERSI